MRDDSAIHFLKYEFYLLLVVFICNGNQLQTHFLEKKKGA